MVSYVPALLALALNLDGIHIFKEPKAAIAGPYLSSVIFMLAVFIFVTHLDVYPRYFKKLWLCGNIVLQFLCSQLVFEYLLADFWFPVEESFSSLITHTVDILDQWDHIDLMKNIVEMLKSETTTIVSSYSLSCFFLLSALHATRVIDVTILDYGIRPFVQDLYRNIEEFFVSSLLNIQSCRTSQKPRKFKCAKNTSKKNYFNDTDEDDGEWQAPKKIVRRRH